MEKCLLQMFTGFLVRDMRAVHTAYNRAHGNEKRAYLNKLLGQESGAVVQGLVRGTLRGVKENNDAVVTS